MPPYQGGGDMILSVTFEKTTYNKIPHKFEAGTPDVSGVIGLAAAINYVNELGLDHRGSRTRPAPTSHGIALYHSRNPSDRHCEGKGERFVIRYGWNSSPRYRNDSRSRRDSHSHRSSLRSARYGALWYSCDGARVFRFLQHARRS